MCRSTLPFAPTKTYGLISVDLRKKRNFFPFLSLALSSRSHTLTIALFSFIFLFDFLSFSFFFPFFKNLNTWLTLRHVSIYHSSPFRPQNNFFFLVQFILNEHSSSHFLTSEIFVKISSRKSLATYHPENRKKIPTISEFDQTFFGH